MPISVFSFVYEDHWGNLYNIEENKSDSLIKVDIPSRIFNKKGTNVRISEL